jgi:hypothetical protein
MYVIIFKTENLNVCSDVQNIRAEGDLGFKKTVLPPSAWEPFSQIGENA